MSRVVSKLSILTERSSGCHSDSDSFAIAPSENRLGLNIEAFAKSFGLSARQTCVLRLLVDGVAPKQIAVLLRLSPNTVRRHAEELYRKCGKRNQRELLAFLTRTLMQEHRSGAIRTSDVGAS